MFEPDRMSPHNLQTAYEQLIPPRQIRVDSTERNNPDKPSEEIHLRKEVLV